MNPIIQQGSFTADGSAKTIKLRSDVDWFKIVNFTQSDAANNGYGVEYFWQYGMGTSMVIKYHPAGDQTMAVDVATSAIQVIDSTNYALGAQTAVTGGTDVPTPVYLTGDTHTTSAVNGTIVRLTGTNHDNLNGLDFSIDAVTLDTEFRLANTLATAPGRIAGASGFYRVVAPNIEVYNMFTPSNRLISDISAAANGLVTTLVDHGYKVGQRVQFNVPAGNGMIELNGVTANITAITASTFTIDINTSTYTAFTFPVYTAVPFTPASVVPVGDNPGYASHMLAPGAFYNQGYVGVVLTAGTAQPAGNSSDVIYWMAGASNRLDPAKVVTPKF